MVNLNETKQNKTIAAQDESFISGEFLSMCIRVCVWFKRIQLRNKNLDWNLSRHLKWKIIV